MLKAIYDISHWGTQYVVQEGKYRNVVLCNRIAMISLAMSLVLMVAAFTVYGVSYIYQYALPSSLIPVAVLLLNRAGKFNIGRLLLSILLPFGAVIIALSTKLQASYPVEDMQYFWPRLFILISPIVPLTTIEYQNKKAIAIGLTFSLIALFLFNPIHNWLGVGHQQLGFDSERYLFFDYMMVICYVLLVASILLLKSYTYKYECRNQALIDDLQEANQIIEEQNQELARNNQSLVMKVDEQTQTLSKTNDELAWHNAELRQFSFILSHNLRSDVANLIGLTQIVSMAKTIEENKNLMGLMQKTAYALDETIRDLNSILYIRDNVDAIKQKVVFGDELLTIKGSLGGVITETNATIEADFSRVPYIYSVKALLDNVIYNLVSNAIKYRVPGKPPKLRVESMMKGDMVQLKFTDNGLGIDLKKHGADLFGMYKRFHLHTEGKGLGLYLVKTQIEALGGRIAVSSDVNLGSTFTVELPFVEMAEKQIYFEDEFALLYFHAGLNLTGVSWKKPVNSLAYREVFSHVLGISRKYRAPNWLSDLRQQGNVKPIDSQWMLKEVMPELVSNGVRRIALVVKKNTPSDDLLEYIQVVRYGGEALGVPIELFDDPEQAEAWFDTYHEPVIA